MNIIVKDKIIVSQEIEEHYKINVNGKEVLVSKFSKSDEFGIEGDTDIFKGKESLNEEEQIEVINFVNELR